MGGAEMSGSLRIAIVGNGGRESALLWALSRSPLVEQTIRRAYGDVDEAFDILVQDSPDLVIIGPETYLVAGLVDRLEETGISVFGPTAAAAKLEGSKAYMKMLCAQNNIPTARFGIVIDFHNATQLISAWGSVPVIKADGLCGGKGVIVPKTKDEALTAAEDMLKHQKYGEAGRIVVIEDRLEGTECSMMFLCQDETTLALPPARDYKRALDGDKGPNTGGMGAYSPLPDVDDALVERVRREIILPALRAMIARGTPFRGVLYAGLMLTAEGPKLLEFNVRFGDPETQVVLPRLACDLVPYLDVIARNEPGSLARLGPLAVSSDAAVCVTLAAEGYPEKPRVGHLIRDQGADPDSPRSDVLVFYGGTQLHDVGMVTAGGRIANVIGVGPTVAAARERAYRRANRIGFQGRWMRTDIAQDV